jgi:two-component system NtrC family sensor kinase
MGATPGAFSAEKLLEKLAARSAHDINNLIAVLAGHLYLLEMPGEASAESLEAMRKAVAQLEQLSRGLGTLGSLGAGEPSPVSLNDVARRAADRAEFGSVRVDLEEGLPEVLGRALDLGAAVASLLANAVESGPPGAAVVLRTSRDPADGSLLLSVTDGGRGIAPEIAGRIFEPFFSTRGGRGRGIGLFLVSVVAAAHGATCGVESLPEGGVRAELRFPAPSGR